MTTATAASMIADINELIERGREEDEFLDPRRVHSFTAQSGETFTAMLTDWEAFVLDCVWYGDETAKTNRAILEKRRPGKAN